MNDTPPPSDKKPRRHGPPRKRATSKRASKQAGDVRTEGVEGVAPVAPRAGDAVPASAGDAPGDAISAPEAIATAIDPAPLAGLHPTGEPPTSDTLALNGVLECADDTGAVDTAVAAADTTAEASATARESRANDRRSRRRADRKPVARDAAPTPVQLPDPTPAPSQPAPARSEAPTQSPAAAAAAEGQAKPAAPTTAIPRQASLRPGELIRVPLSVRWRDLDAFNHVNNSKYLSYLEEARLRWMLTVPGMGLDEDVAPVVAASNLNYRRPISWPGDVVIELFVERIGNTSLTIGHRVVDGTERGVTYCDGQVVMVWIDRTSGRAAPLPAAVRDACATR